MALFDKYADATLERVKKTYSGRGEEYGDTMRDCQWLTMRAVAQRLGVALPAKYARVIAIAGLLDLKYQRMQGGYKDDNLVDHGAYAAFVAQEMKELLGEGL